MRALEEVETIKRILLIHLYSKTTEWKNLGRWGKGENWDRLGNIEVRMVIRGRVMLLSLELG